VQAGEKLWSDRDYAWADGQSPTDILDGEWTYIRVPLETSNKAPCANEGGFNGFVAEHCVAAICCANHCGQENTPTGGGAWTQHPGTFQITQHGGEPCTFYETRLQPGDYQLCCETCWASGAFFSHFHHELPMTQDASIGGAGALPCDGIATETAAECNFSVGSSAPLWSDRDYAWIEGPTDILSNKWTYMQVALEVGSGAPCPHEGGFRGAIREDAVVAVCCANHCGQSNRPMGSLQDDVWTEHPGTWAITGHGGAPCTFFESRVKAGQLEICCSSCWASGVFFAMAEAMGEITGTGPVPCSSVVSATMKQCVFQVAAAQTLWSDRDYAWLTAPAGMLDGAWTYLQVPLEVGHSAPCPHEGGFSGTISSEVAVAVCCANHCGQENLPTATPLEGSPPVEAQCLPEAIAECHGFPCVDLREDAMHHHIMWYNSVGSASIMYFSIDRNHAEGRSWDCTCDACDGLVGVWACPGFYTDVITISSDFGDDFTPARENDHMDVCVSVDWVQHPGTFAITNHGGEPCTFYETQLSAGDYTICCESCWASGLFISKQAVEAASCKEVLDSSVVAGARASDGMYRIDPDGAGGVPAFSVYCDMTTAGGGWALVADREDDMPTVLTQGTLALGDHSKAIDDVRFAAMKRLTTQVMVASSGESKYVNGDFEKIVADVSVLKQANCRSWWDLSSLLQTPLVWDEDSAPECLGQGGDYSEILGHGNSADGGGLDVTSTTHFMRHNFIGDRSQLKLYGDVSGVGDGGEGEFQYAAVYLRAAGVSDGR